MDEQRRRPLKEISNTIVDWDSFSKDVLVVEGPRSDHKDRYKGELDVPTTEHLLDGMFSGEIEIIQLLSQDIIHTLPAVANILVDRWRLRKLLSNSNYRHSTRKVNKANIEIKPYDFNKAKITISQLDRIAFAILEEVKEVSIVLPRPVFYQFQQGFFQFQSPCIAYDGNIRFSITTISSFAHDMHLLLTSALYSLRSDYAVQSPPRIVESAIQHTPVSYGSEVVTEELELNKLQISFLIGENGSRIEHIKQMSFAVIKVLPIKNKLHTHDIRNPESVNQTLAITGYLLCVTRALAIIKAYLDLYRMNIKRKF
ncbi:HHR059Cp [Eremothecium sinecaudum]|uniref:HHR059Cp n=1 Tax=Eremothecium sinecaudum TaxID=45286 RepID=A0A109V0N3_9SACH|nr:HHR059Cp [Eremothecium sinecaudum]AMD22828.1 HHR059Cp [Eremothecium sinecaudum]